MFAWILSVISIVVLVLFLVILVSLFRYSIPANHECVVHSRYSEDYVARGFGTVPIPLLEGKWKFGVNGNGNIFTGKREVQTNDLMDLPASPVSNNFRATLKITYRIEECLYLKQSFDSGVITVGGRYPSLSDVDEVVEAWCYSASGFELKRPIATALNDATSRNTSDREVKFSQMKTKFGKLGVLLEDVTLVLRDRLDDELAVHLMDDLKLADAIVRGFEDTKVPKGDDDGYAATSSGGKPVELHVNEVLVKVVGEIRTRRIAMAMDMEEDSYGDAPLSSSDGPVRRRDRGPEPFWKLKKRKKKPSVGFFGLMWGMPSYLFKQAWSCGWFTSKVMVATLLSAMIYYWATGQTK